MPPAKKTAARKTTAAKAIERPAPPIPPEASEPMTGILNGREVGVMPLGKWRNSAMNALRNGDLDAWADACLTDEGYEVWEEEDPTFEEFAAFLTSFTDEMANIDTPLPGARNRQQRRASGRRR